MTIDYKYGLGLTIIINSVIVIFKFYEKILQKKGNRLFSFSFEEANRNNTLIVKSNEKIQLLEENKNIDNFYFNKIENTYSYELIFETRNELDIVKEKIQKLDKIIDFQIKYGN